MNECLHAYESFLKVFGIYIDNPRKIEIQLLNPDKFPQDANKIPACTNHTPDGYVIYFSISALLNQFKDYVKLICWHEVAHVVTDELYRCNKITQPPRVHGGHPILFFKVMDLMEKTPSEEKMQNIRHEIPYNYGRTDDVPEDYDPTKELLELNKRFSHRIMQIFNK